MNRKEAIEFYVELKKSGKLDEFNRKDPKIMTPKEKDLFYYDDDEVFYNPFVGKLDSVYDPLIHTKRLDDNVFQSLLSGEKTFSDLSEDEFRRIGIDD